MESILLSLCVGEINILFTGINSLEFNGLTDTNQAFH